MLSLSNVPSGWRAIVLSTRVLMSSTSAAVHSPRSSRSMMGAYVAENLLFVSSSTTAAFAAQKLEWPTRSVWVRLLSFPGSAAAYATDFFETGES